MRLSLFCKCGAGLEGKILPDSLAVKVVAAWYEVHAGEGHRGTDRATAKKTERENGQGATA